jgi:hypothetical protein
MDYWKECITEAFNDIGIEATEKQIAEMADFVEGAHENIGMSTGAQCIPNPCEKAAEEKVVEMKRAKALHDDWVATTSPCKECFTAGFKSDRLGSVFKCSHCDGKGRVRD